MEIQTKKLILASASPRRRDLIGLGGWQVEVASADIDETPFANETPADYVGRLAAAKARAVAAQFREDAIVLAADTTVADGAQLLGKPADPAEARAMLTQLRGRIHHVYTGIAVYDLAEDRLLTEVVAAEVPMRAYSDAEIEAYIATGDPFDKAGGYAIQHPQFHPVENFSGCYANVVGLPLCHLTRMLKKFGLVTSQNVPQNCQAHLDYACPVYLEILN